MTNAANAQPQGPTDLQLVGWQLKTATVSWVNPFNFDNIEIGIRESGSNTQYSSIVISFPDQRTQAGIRQYPITLTNFQFQNWEAIDVRVLAFYDTLPDPTYTSADGITIDNPNLDGEPDPDPDPDPDPEDSVAELEWITGGPLGNFCVTSKWIGEAAAAQTVQFYVERWDTTPGAEQWVAVGGGASASPGFTAGQLSVKNVVDLTPLGTPGADQYRFHYKLGGEQCSEYFELSYAEITGRVPDPECVVQEGATLLRACEYQPLVIKVWYRVHNPSTWRIVRYRVGTGPGVYNAATYSLEGEAPGDWEVTFGIDHDWVGDHMVVIERMNESEEWEQVGSSILVKVDGVVDEGCGLSCSACETDDGKLRVDFNNDLYSPGGVTATVVEVDSGDVIEERELAGQIGPQRFIVEAEVEEGKTYRVTIFNPESQGSQTVEKQLDGAADCSECCGCGSVNPDDLKADRDQDGCPDYVDPWPDDPERGCDYQQEPEYADKPDWWKDETQGGVAFPTEWPIKMNDSWVRAFDNGIFDDVVIEEQDFWIHFWFDVPVISGVVGAFEISIHSIPPQESMFHDEVNWIRGVIKAIMNVFVTLWFGRLILQRLADY